MTSLIALALVAFASADMTATRLEGPPVAGALRSWSGDEIVIATPTGEERLAAKELLSLRGTAIAPGTPSAATTATVELVDGTVLPIDDFSTSGTTAKFALHSELPTEKRAMSLETKQLAAVRLLPLPASVAGQWDEIRAENVPADMVVVLKRDGQSLDYAQGVLGDVTSSKIAVQVDDEAMRVDRAKVAGLIYYHADRPKEVAPYCKLRGHNGMHATAAKVELEEGVVHVTTVSGAVFDWPLEGIDFADFSAGKVAYLSDLEGAEKWTPLVSLPAAAKASAAFGRVRHDQSPYGGPLTVWIPDQDGPLSIGHEQSFNKGLAIRSRSEIVYRVPAGFRRFLAVAGISPTVSGNGSVRLTIAADDRSLLEQEIVGGQAPTPIEINVESVRRIKIIVDYGRNLDTGDWLNLCDARFVK